MGIVKDIVSAAMPYVVIGGVGYLAYRAIAKSDVGQAFADLPDKIDKAADRTPSEWGSAIFGNIPIVKAFQGDWGGALMNTNPLGYVWNLLN